MKGYLLLLLPIGIWLAVSLNESYSSGWNLLAKAYKSSEQFNGEHWNFITGYLKKKDEVDHSIEGSSPFGRSLNIGANCNGLHLSVFILFRLGHPSLFIPWNDISISLEEGLVTTYMKFSFLKVPLVSLYISEDIGHEVIKYAGWHSTDAT